MKTTKNLGLNVIGDDDFVEIDKINENTEKIDEELAKKADVSGGDISEMVITTAEASQAEYPVPAAGDSTKMVLGKVQKFFTDIRNWMTGVCLLGQIVNNCVTNRSDLPLSAAMGKQLRDAITVLNTKSKKAIDTIGKNDCLTIVNNKINTALQPDGKVVVLASFSVNISGLYLISPRIRMRCPAGYNAVFKISGTQDVQYELGAYSDAFVLSPSGYCSSNHFMDFELDAGKIYYILGQTSCTEPITVLYMNTTAILLKQTD